MNETLQILKGIHPGFFLERQLKKRNLSKGQFALSIREYPQTITAISKGKRAMNLKLALRIEKVLDLEEGLLMQLQLFYDIKKEKQKVTKKLLPDISKIRPSLFWDTKMDKIDWDKHKKFVITRTFEKGNEKEKAEIKRFYGNQKIKEILTKA